MLLLVNKVSNKCEEKGDVYGQKETIGRGNEKTNIRRYLYVGVRTRIIWPGAISVNSGAFI
jgi:hypothetical protein